MPGLSCWSFLPCCVGEERPTGEAGQRALLKGSHMVMRYACGHVGKVTGVKVRRWVRVAEIRRELVLRFGTFCPDCQKRDD